MTLPGFKTGVRRGLVLQVGDRLNVAMSLPVGEVHEQVTLVAQAPLLEAETSSLGQVVDTTTIVTLPLNGRNYLQLGNLTAGTVPTTRSRDRSFSAYGNRGLQNTFLLFQPPETKKPLFIQNQFGGTMGGPILKNRAFFFASYEGTRIRNQSPVLATVPTQDLRNGIFRGVPIFDPLTTRPNPSGAGFVRDAFPNGVVPRERWDPIAARLIDFFPPPNRPRLVNNFVRNPRAADAVDRLDTRVDHKWSDKDSFFARFSLSQGRQDLVTTLPPPANVPIFRDVNTRGVALGQTHTLNPRTVSGRNILRGPGLVNFDFALYRDFRIAEALTLQFRGEIFDVTNTPHFDMPGRTIGTPQAGVISSAGPPRQIQFGLKVIF